MNTRIFRNQSIHLTLLACLVASPAFAKVRLPAILGSNMVLQCDQPVPVWGHADPGEKIVVEFRGQRVGAVAAATGTWQVVLAPLTASDEPATMMVRGENTLTLKNVLVGEVWLCSGQSNMTLALERTDDAKAVVAAAKHPTMRLFTVARRAVESEPQKDCKGAWVECTSETAGQFSAVAYFFGEELLRRHGRPVGLIHSSWGGTRAEAWTPRATLEHDPELRPILENWAIEVADFPRKKAEFETQKEKLLADWKIAVKNAGAAGRMPPSEPRLRTGPNTQYAPVGLYNGMIAPLAPFALRGVAWYQGEANVGDPRRYARLFPAMIAAWRAAWDRPELPFVWVQLPNLARQPEPSKSGWAELREAQLKTLAVSHTAMAVTIDIGDPRNLHPTNKRPVGERLALAADGLVYQSSPAKSFSPRPKPTVTVSQGRVRLECEPAVDLVTHDGQPARGFVVAGADRKFLPAAAELRDGVIWLSNPAVPEPVAVRYAWADNPDANVMSRYGLPLSPFRTDNWPTPVLSAEGLR